MKNLRASLLGLAFVSASAIAMASGAFATVYVSSNATNPTSCQIRTNFTIPSDCATTNLGPQCSITETSGVKFLFNSISGSTCQVAYKRP